MSAISDFGNAALCLLSDGQAAGRQPQDILRDIQAAAQARPELHDGTGQVETEQLARARASVLAEGVLVAVGSASAAAKSKKLFEAKVDLLIQVAKRDALIEAAERDRRAR